MIVDVEKRQESFGKVLRIVVDQRGLKDLIHALTDALDCGGSSYPGFELIINVERTENLSHDARTVSKKWAFDFHEFEGESIYCDVCGRVHEGE